MGLYKLSVLPDKSPELLGILQRMLAGKLTPPRDYSSRRPSSVLGLWISARTLGSQSRLLFRHHRISKGREFATAKT